MKKKLSVLYIEDDEVTRKNIVAILELLVYKIYEVQDGEEAIAVYDANDDINLVIADCILPKKTGNEVIRYIRAKDPLIPIFVTSSCTEKDNLMDLIGYNLISFLEKPITYEKLKSSLDKATEILEGENKLDFVLLKEYHYNYMEKNLLKEDQKIELTKKESMLIELLLSYKTKVFTFDEISESLGIEINANSSNSIRNIIYRLRKKTSQDIVMTHKDLGFSLE